MHPAVASLYSGTLQFTVGLLLATVLSDWRGQVTPGFLRINTLTAVCAAFIVLMVGANVPGTEHTLIVALTILSVLTFILLWFPGGRFRLFIGAVSSVVGV